MYIDFKRLQKLGVRVENDDRGVHIGFVNAYPEQAYEAINKVIEDNEFISARDASMLTEQMVEMIGEKQLWNAIKETSK